MLYEVTSLSLVVLWALQHSVLATNRVKSKVVTDLFDKNYRIAYNIVSILTFLGLEAFITGIIAPLGTNLTPLLNLQTTRSQLIYYSMLGIGGVLGVSALIQSNLIIFVGIRSEQSSDVKINGVYRFSRHPLYAGGILAFIALLLATTNSVEYFKLIGYIGYLVIGGRFEENRLRTTLDGYEQMFTRGYLFPFRLNHFRILFGRSK